MSYDLYFRQKSSLKPFTSEGFNDYFSNRRNYQSNADQAVYSNDVTGVYFSFELTEGEDESPEPEDGGPVLPVTFNLNFIRPHLFGLEAEPEVSAFVEHFSLTVSDPQTSGMGDGEYSKEGFLNGWNAGNRFGYQAILSRGELNQPTMPTVRLEETWRWNYDVPERQSELGDTRFVPRIMYVLNEGEIRTIAVWGDGIPILLPKVDLVIVPRSQLAPRAWFRKKEDAVHFSWAELEPTLKRFRKDRTGAYELFYDSTPAEIEQLIRNKKPAPQQLTGVPFDQILNREMVEKANPETRPGQ